MGFIQITPYLLIITFSVFRIFNSMGNKRSSHSSEEKENKEKDDQKSGKTKQDQPNNDSKAATKPGAIPERLPPDKQQSPAVPSPTPAQTSPSIKPPGQSSSSSGPTPPDLSMFVEDTKNLLLGKFSIVKCRLRPQMVRIYVSAASVGKSFLFLFFLCFTH